MNVDQTQDFPKVKLEAIIKQIKALPTLPAVAQQMLSHLEDDDISLDDVAEKVAHDQSLAAAMLRLANSSYYGNNSKVVTLQQAVTLLGITQVKNLIRLTAVNHGFTTIHSHKFNFKAFWRHSVATAECAELISRTLHMKHDFAFTAGLLHDIGRLVLASCFPAQYDQVLTYRQKHDCYLLEAEHAVLSIDHIEAGLCLAEHWQFSEAICDAIRGHHQPDISGLNSIASIVHVADIIVHGLDLTQIDDDLAPILCAQAWNSLHLSKNDYFAIFKETEMRFEAIDAVL